MRVLVTGANGFTGRYLVAELRSTGCDVVPLTSNLTNAQDVDSEIAAVRPDRVIHLAALAFAGGKEIEPFYQVNQLGTFKLLESVARHAGNAHVLVASSGNIYGNNKVGFLNEMAEPRPANHYAMSKWFMELGAQFWAERVHMTIARPFNYTGIGQDERYLIPKIVGHYKRREKLIRLGNIDVSRDFGDVRSVVEAYVALSLNPPSVPVVNIGTGSVYSIRQLIEIASRLTQHDIDIQTEVTLMRANEVELLAGDINLLRQLLPSWRPKGIQETLEWMLSS